MPKAWPHGSGVSSDCLPDKTSMLGVQGLIWFPGWDCRGAGGAVFAREAETKNPPFRVGRED